MNVELDHVIWGCSDLDAGRAEIQRRLDAEPVIGGRHPGVGTRNALLGLEARLYFEVLAPDPEQDRFTGFGRFVESLDGPRMVSWAGRSDDLEALAAKARRGGLKPGPILDLSRKRPDGSTLSWRLMTVGGHSFGPLVPFFIQWKGDHPCDRLPPAAALQRLRLSTPDSNGLRRILQVLEIDAAPVEVVEGPSSLVATFSSSVGDVEL